LGVTGHYIDSAKENPMAWELKCEQLAYTPLHGNHSGANMSKILLHTLDRYDIRDKVIITVIFNSRLIILSKVGWFTADNATNNDTALANLAEELNADNDDDDTPSWDPVEHRVRSVIHPCRAVPSIDAYFSGVWNMPSIWGQVISSPTSPPCRRRPS
jgi:hypothetical protein